VKIVEALWERRNLEMEVTEIVLDSRDLENESNTLEILRERLVPRRYLLVKVPTGAVAFLTKLQALGFIFLECQYTISRKIKNYVIPPEFSPLARRVSFEPLSEDPAEWAELCRLIGDDTFTTDRVALDPLFNLSVANKRYRNWLMDMKGNPSITVTRIQYGEKSIGFFAGSIDAETRTAHGLIGGIFKKYQGTGLGGSIILGPLVLNAAREMNKFSTAISSNNFEVFQWYVFFNFHIDNASYVFRCYRDEK
jgi:hypothetical protein